VLCN